MGRYVYHFASGSADGNAAMNELLGAKGAGLAEMARLGISVPPGMTITTEACAHYLRSGRLPAGLRREVRDGIARIEAVTERGWGDAEMPLLLSVRAGGPESMPGMMETVLNLGINDELAPGLEQNGGDQKFIFDCRQRQLRTYARVVLGVPEQRLNRPLKSLEEELNHEDARQAQVQALRELREIIREEGGRDMPDDPNEQLWRSIRAIFDGWNSPHVVAYRKLHGIEPGPGTAVTIMGMVFGNRDHRSASGVGFTRNPATGHRRAYGEYLSRSQGDEIVGGHRSPGPLNKGDRFSDETVSLEKSMPEIHDELCQVLQRLEQHFGDMQEIEFTVESGRLWILQTRRATRTGPAALRVALEMIEEGLIDDEEAVMRVDPVRHIPELLHRRIDPHAEHSEAVARGIGASPGAAVGRLVTNAAEAVAMSRRGEKVVLVCPVTSADDVDALEVVDALVTTEGGLTSHAAEVAREVGLPCVCGAWPIAIADDHSGIDVDGRFVPRGEVMTVDGTGGEVFVGEIRLVGAGEGDRALARFLDIADRFRRMDVRVDADTLDEVDQGLGFGADGIGMCRTEEMILASHARVMAMRRVLLSDDEEEAQEAMNDLLRSHRHDLAQILRIADSRPVTVRLLDAPLSRFLPDDETELVETAEALEMEVEEVTRQVEALQESNPMLGLRGCRLAVVHPSLYEMQIQAIVEASRMVVDAGITPLVEILIPRASEPTELARVVRLVDETIARHLHGATQQISLDVGALIQLPRAALACEELADSVDFIVLATADLTRLCWGMSSDDVGRYMTTYLDERLVSHDPFESLDREGVGELVRLAIGRGRSRVEDLVAGVDAGHGSDMRSIRFFETLDVDYVTVKPADVAATRVAAARAYVDYERSMKEWIGAGEAER